MHLCGCHRVLCVEACPGQGGPVGPPTSQSPPLRCLKDSATPQEGLHHTLPRKLGGSPLFWSKGWRPLEGVQLSRVGVGPRPICLELDGN